jgi:hypothetical protein
VLRRQLVNARLESTILKGSAQGFSETAAFISALSYFAYWQILVGTPQIDIVILRRAIISFYLSESLFYWNYFDLLKIDVICWQLPAQEE